MALEQHEYASLRSIYLQRFRPRANIFQGQYQPFSDITRNSLGHALADFGLSLDNESVEQLMKAYDSLSTFPDVSPALKALAHETDFVPVIFSNGTNSMVTNSVQSSPDLGPHAAVFQDIVTVEDVKCFKPNPKVYYHLAGQMGKRTEMLTMGDMWLVSGNPFDVVGAMAVGMRAAWVDRGGAGWTDGLVKGGENGEPTAIVRGLEELVEVIGKHSRSG